MKPFFRLLAVWLVLSILLSACGLSGGLVGKQVTVQIVYGSEKQDWLDPLVQEFNAARHKTAEGTLIVVEALPMGSIESMEAILSGSLQPTVWSPASTLYLPVAESEWRKSHADDLMSGPPEELVLSPVVIAMWKPMAEVLGWPDRPIGWADIAELATSSEGWAAYGYPEWGQFKLGHTHPGFSNSGLMAVLAQTYAGADKQRGLTMDDLQDPGVQQFMADVQLSIIHYGTSTGFFGSRMFDRGPSYLSAAVLYENLIVAQETKRLSGQSQQLPVIAIYPKEGTFWSNHPYVILNAPWVTDEQRQAAVLFQDFLLADPQQRRAIELGFRPVSPSVPLTAPLDMDHGVDIEQPKTVLAVPSAEVIVGAQALWKQVKKPVDLVVVMDTSGSMSGSKIGAARTSLGQFVDLLDDRDRLQVILFNSEVMELTPLSELGPKRDDVKRRISGIIEGGNTSLYDAVRQAYADLERNGNPQHIRAVVVLSDGQDTSSALVLEQVLGEIGSFGEDPGNSIKLFTIGYGKDADADVLTRMAEMTGGKYYQSSPENIQKIYAEIATFF